MQYISLLDKSAIEVSQSRVDFEGMELEPATETGFMDDTHTPV
jgi:hypothetical protein